MSFEFSESRNVSLSVYYRLWGILLQNGWTSRYVGVPLSLLTGNDEYTKEPLPPATYQYTDYPKPFVFIDQYNNPAASGVTVYVSGQPVSPTGYVVDYINARVTFNASPTGAVTADLNLFDVEVVEGYPDTHELLTMDIPIIAYQLETDDGRDAFLGTFLQFNRRFINVFVMARGEGERQDLTYDIKRFIRFVPYVDYSSHKPLTETNALDLQFSYADQLINRMACPSGVRSDYLKPRPGGSDKERYRSMISFEVERIS